MMEIDGGWAGAKEDLRVRLSLPFSPFPFLPSPRWPLLRGRREKPVSAYLIALQGEGEGHLLAQAAAGGRSTLIKGDRHHTIYALCAPLCPRVRVQGLSVRGWR